MTSSAALDPLVQPWALLALSFPFLCVSSYLLGWGTWRAGLTSGTAGSDVCISKRILLPSSEKCQWSRPGIGIRRGRKGARGVKHLVCADVGVLSGAQQ